MILSCARFVWKLQSYLMNVEVVKIGSAIVASPNGKKRKIFVLIIATPINGFSRNPRSKI
jgi:hypothetical protein